MSYPESYEILSYQKSYLALGKKCDHFIYSTMDLNLYATEGDVPG